MFSINNLIIGVLNFDPYLCIFSPYMNLLTIVSPLFYGYLGEFPSCRACSTSSAFLFAMERDTRRRKRAKMDVKDIGTYWTSITPQKYGSGCTTYVCVYIYYIFSHNDWGNSWKYPILGQLHIGPVPPKNGNSSWIFCRRTCFRPSHGGIFWLGTSSKDEFPIFEQPPNKEIQN